jgi:hypothetical protein
MPTAALGAHRKPHPKVTVSFFVSPCFSQPREKVYISMKIHLLEIVNFIEKVYFIAGRPNKVNRGGYGEIE